MRIVTGLMTFMLTVAIPAAAAFSQRIGDPKEGLRYALETCSGCHAVRPDPGRSRHPAARSFMGIANVPGMTAIALIAWFQSPHRLMPHIRMKDEDMRNVVQYLLSLKKE